jgi:galactokinase
MTDPRPAIHASQWLEALPAPGMLPSQATLVSNALHGFINLHGNGPVRVFRSPGRINLRGMHVDTHGGYLNLMTHQREVVAVCRPRTDGAIIADNLDHRHARVELRRDSRDLHTQAVPGSWGRYVEGAVLAAGEGMHTGLDMFVASDLPEGAALSSSSALCLAVLLAVCAHNDRSPSEAEQILACRSAEWHTGARTGTSDPAAMVLGRRGEVAHLAMLPERFSIAGVERAPFPEDELAVLVVDSRTKRSLSGAQKIAYVANRFAYSLALDVLRKEMLDMGFSPERIEICDRLCQITPDIFGGVRFMGATLLRVPERMEIAALRARYHIEHIEALQEQYFGTLPRIDWPEDVPLRGPLVYGIAESARAEKFFASIKSGAWAEAGAMMSIGHDGDRIITPLDAAYDRRVHPLQLANLADNNLSIERIPGDYGASAPVLDAIVDTAVGAGALGASLTGAGIAGSVLALCRRDDAARVQDAIVHLLSSARYARLAGRGEPLSRADAEASVVLNHSTPPAGEVLLP